MYNKYKANLNREKFFSNWIPEQYNAMSQEMRDNAYAKYLLKSKVFNRDSFTCQNQGCKYCGNLKDFHKLTVHHIKHKRNGGEDKERNCVLICRGSHNAFNRCKGVLVFADKDNLPPHIRGHTFQLHNNEEKVDWKQIKKDMGELRRQVKHTVKESMKHMDADGKVWFGLTLEQLMILMKFLDKRYVEREEDDL